MSIPKEPRQIMINLMYLVLTALLALNVSNEILNAFRTLSYSIDKSNESIDQKTSDLYKQMKENEKLPGQEEKVRPYREKADLVVKKSQEMIDYLDNWKKRVVNEAGGYSKEDPKFPDRMDNIDATTKLLVEKKGGDSLKARIEEMRKFFLASVGDSNSIKSSIPLVVDPAKKTDNNPTGNWSIGNFEHMPAIAAMALFSKFENDVRNSEAAVVKDLFEEAHGTEIHFDSIVSVAVPKQSYLLDGQKVEAEILLAAFNPSLKPTTTVNSGTVKSTVDGVISWEGQAKGTGMQTVSGRITLSTANKTITRDWKFQYMVGTTGASMQLDKMNVFYIGVANPVTVTAAGYSVEDVSIDVPGGEARADSFARKGHYNVWVDKPGTITVAINAKGQDGKPAKVGELPIRVKRIPDPIAKLGGNKGGPMPAGLSGSQVAPEAVLEGFEFNAKFVIVSFTFSMQPKGRDYQGPFTVESRTGCRLQGPGQNDQIAKLQAQAKPGDRIFIEGIKAVGPDKTNRLLGSLVFTLTN